MVDHQIHHQIHLFQATQREQNFPLWTIEYCTVEKILFKYQLFFRTGDQKVHLGAERGGQGVLGPGGGGQQYRDGKAGLAGKI